MDVHEPPSRNRRRERLVVDADPATVHAMPRRGDRQRLRCHDVARNRAQRYARRHRTARLLRSLISVIILIELAFERRPGFGMRLAAPGRSTGLGATAAMTAVPQDEFMTGQPTKPAAEKDTGGGIEAPSLVHRPPETFLARDVAQIVAFLIRNRGRVDNEVVRMKWAMLDRVSLPLAVYLRDVEAKGAWNDLDDEIPRSQLPSPKNSERRVRPSLRHQRILGLLPEWSSRGDTLLALLAGEPADRQPFPEVDDDDHDREPPTPGRPSSSRRD